MKIKEINKSNSTIVSAIKTILLFSIIVANTSAISQNIEKTIKSKLDSIVINSAIAYDIPGISIGIVKNTEVVYLKNYGVKNVDTREPVAKETQFRMASVSKIVTAVAIMQLYENGMIDLKKPVFKYVPYFKFKNQNYKLITIEHLLTHKSGLPGDNKAYTGEPDFSDDALKNFTINLFDKDLEFIPGEKYSYNNTGFIILSAIISEVTNTRFEEYVQNYIFDPIGMKNSTFNLGKKNEFLSARHVIGEDFNNSVCKYDPATRWKNGAGGLISTATDMCLFAQTLINGGRINNRQIINSESLEMMWKKRENTGSKGLAWSVYNVWEGRKLVDHGGNTLGVSVELAIMPEDSLAIVVLCNNRNGGEWPIAAALLKTMLGYKLMKPKYYPDYVLQKKLREEGQDSALIYLKKKLEEKIEEVSCYDMMLLAYRLVQGAGDENLEISKTILELLAEYFPNDSRINDMLGEIYFKLSIKQYKELVKKEPQNWAGKKMLELLEEINIEFY